MIVENPWQCFVFSFQVLDDKTHLNIKNNNENTQTHTQIMIICFRFAQIAVHFDNGPWHPEMFKHFLGWRKKKVQDLSNHESGLDIMSIYFLNFETMKLKAVSLVDSTK